MNKKILRISLIFLVLVVIMISVIFLMKSNDITNQATAFLNDYYTVEDNKLYQQVMETPIDEMEEFFNSTALYEDLLTNNVINHLVANRSILSPDKSAYELACTITCDNIVLEKEMDDTFSFTVKIQVVYSDMSSNKYNIEGQISMKKENNIWKVDSFTQKQDVSVVLTQ